MTLESGSKKKDVAQQNSKPNHMKNKFTARDLKIFLFGVVTTLAVVFLFNWQDSMTDVKEGLEQGPADYEASRN